MTITVTCPHCGTVTHADEKFAGSTGPCRSCGKTITIAGHPFATDPMATAPPHKSGGGGLTVLAILGVCAVVGFCIIGILVALLLPAVQAAREAARRSQCINNLRQIQLAILNYESAYGEFPPAFVADEDGKPMHSWRVLILPFMEENQLFSQYDMSEPWDSPGNLKLTKDYCPPVFQCPSDPSSGTSTNTHYLAVAGPEALFNGSTPRKIGELLDGTSRTLCVVEVQSSDVHWSEPRDFDVTNSTLTIGMRGTPNEIGSGHPAGANVSFADGSCRFFAAGMDPNAIRAATTVAGGETADANF